MKDYTYKETNMKELFTREGRTVLNNRLKTLTNLYLKNIHYPFEAQMFGFHNLKIFSKEHHQGMIDELSQILYKKEIIVEVK